MSHCRVYVLLRLNVPLSPSQFDSFMRLLHYKRANKNRRIASYKEKRSPTSPKVTSSSKAMSSPVTFIVKGDRKYLHFAKSKVVANLLISCGRTVNYDEGSDEFSAKIIVAPAKTH